MAKARYSRPTSQVDLEERLKNDNAAPAVLKDTNPAESTAYYTKTGFVGTDPVYQNYANETDAPRKAEDGPDKLAEEYVEKQVMGTVSSNETPATKITSDEQAKPSTSKKS